MTKACIFSHYYDLNYIPYYVQIYIKELSQYFDQILIVTNHREITNLSEVENPTVKILLVQNQGYDLGMFYKGLQSLEKDKYDTIACINDSNILIGRLDRVFAWADTVQIDFWGMIDAETKPGYSIHQDNNHIQSHFIVFNKKAIEYLPAYFESIPWQEIINTKEVKTVKRLVINHWEIGLSQYFFSKGLIAKTFIDHKIYTQKYNIAIDSNVSLSLYTQLIKDDYPFIKKKIITAVPFKSFGSNQIGWEKLISDHSDTTIDIDRLIKELKKIRWRHYKNRILRVIKFLSFFAYIFHAITT